MIKSAVLAGLAAAASIFTPAMAQTSGFDSAMNTMWEVLWHQSGTATRLVRWEQDIKVRVRGVNAAAHRQNTVKALREVAAEAGVKVIDVSDRADMQPNVDVEIVPNSALQENQPCVTRLDFQSETTIDGAAMQMRDSDAQRCAYHESMHVMGVRGHPEGETVLSYFKPHVHGLMPLDRAMLRAWYSPKIKAGMTPFEVLPVLAEQLVGSMKDKAAAARARDGYLSRTVADMEAFAEGRGDVPTIVKRSGKSSDMGIRYGRMEMSYFLGVAYQQGAAVRQDGTLAQRWLQKAASMGSKSAAAKLATGTMASNG